MERTRETIRNIIYTGVGLVISLLFLRLLFAVAGLNNAFFVDLVNGASDIFLYPFRNIVINTTAIVPALDFNIVIAIGIYIGLAYLLSKIITGILGDSLYDITQELVDSFFKVMEFIVGLRILFEVFAIIPGLRDSAFVDGIFFWSEWTQSLLFRIPLGDGFINLSAIVWLGILIILDIFSGRYLARILGGTVVVASASTSVIRKTRFNLPSFKRSDSDNRKEVESSTAPKEVFIEVPPPTNKA